MSGPRATASIAVLSCRADRRRAQVGASSFLCGLDDVEVSDDGLTLRAHLFGRLPEGLTARNVRIEGGERIRDLQVLEATFDGGGNDGPLLTVVVDRRGDFSTYWLCLVAAEAADSAACGHDPAPPDALVRHAPPGVDERYACVGFGFRLDCPSELDCRPLPCASTKPVPPPDIDYLARDFQGFRTLLLDRLAVTMPAFRERHVPDLMLTLVELLAYRADQLSYQLDAVATEAYLATARRRISVRRHARLLDYRLHEGCNARAWITIDAQSDIDLDLDDLVFAAPPPGATLVAPGSMDWTRLRTVSGATLFEALALPGTYVETIDPAASRSAGPAAANAVIRVRAAHGTIAFHRWGATSCCLPEGATAATLVDQQGHAAKPTRVLDLAAGNYLVLEEMVGAVTGVPADADRRKRHVVRLVAVERTVDRLDGTLLLEVAWHPRDALPFALCVSATTPAPACKDIVVAVAHGNVVLVDHGTRVRTDDTWTVDGDPVPGCCACDGAVSDTAVAARPLRFALPGSQITHAAPLPTGDLGAAAFLAQDPRNALPQIRLDVAIPDASFPEAEPTWQERYAWTSAFDLLSAGVDDRAFVAEFDDDGRACIRFGDGLHGRQPQAGWRFRACHRVGNGTGGNVGADSIVWMTTRSTTITGNTLRPRNPLAAAGGLDPEAVASAKLRAPHAYARSLERAIRADDYAAIAMADPRIEGAHASLAWTGAFYEATVALDPFVAAEADADLATTTRSRLDAARRIGHDVRIVPARRVPLQIALDLCVAPGHARSDVVRAVGQVLSTHIAPDGSAGLFHEDRLVFGEDVAASRVIAAVQAVPGVAHVELVRFARAQDDDDLAKLSLANAVVTIGAGEIAQLENDPDFPERGVITISARGGR